MLKVIETTGFWIQGCDSRNDPAYIGQNNYVWGINGLHRGGIFRTRPGLGEAIAAPITHDIQDAYNPQGLTLFKPIDGVWYIVIAYAGQVYKAPFPLGPDAIFTPIVGLPALWPFGQILFETAEKSSITNPDGSLTFVPIPYPVLMIQDGISPACYWDGTFAGVAEGVPTGQAHIWNSQRYWVGDGNKIHASNEGDPLGFTEEKLPATGGFLNIDRLNMSSDITCMVSTPDLQALLVFTEDTTETIQSAILDRTTWGQTPGFQKELFRNIGCVGPKAAINQYGITYWMSHNGIVELDTALQTYRTRRLRYSDYAMSRSRKTLFKDLSGVCAASFENFLMFSVPSGDQYNAHTWVMDETSFESGGNQNPQTSSWAGIWKGIRPVEWATTVIDGVSRCFAFSRDYPSTPGGSYRLGIWEAFCPQRADVLLDGTVKPITCGFETRQMLWTSDPKKLSAIEADCSEIVGQVNHRLFFNGRRSSFTKVGSKMIVASEGSIGGPLQSIIHDTDILGSYLPQQRLIRSNEILIANQTTQGVQSPRIQTVDRAFGVYLEWDGEMAVNSVRIFADPQPELQLGRCEADETTARIVDWTGKEQLLTTPPVPTSAHPKESSFVDSISQRFIEPAYSSR